MSDYPDYAPDGAYGEGGGDFRLNFSAQEAASEAREFSVLPSGSYLVVVDDVELREVKDGKNAGKPMANFTFKVTEDAFGGKFVGQKAFSLVMLFSGALYSAAQMMKSQGLNPETDNFPALEWWMGKELVIIGSQKNAQKKDPDGRTDSKGKPLYVDDYEEVPLESDPTKTVRKAKKRYEVNGYKSAATWKKAAATKGSQGSSLLPS